MTESKWSFSQDFTVQFNKSRSELETRINNAKLDSNPTSEALIQELSQVLANLVKSLAAATGSIPSYDQRQYEQQTKALEISLTELRSSSRPKSKFAFKRKPAAPVSSSSPATSVAVDSKPSLTPSTNLSLSGRSHEFLTIDSLPQSSSPEDLVIHDLHHCIVNLIPSNQDDPPRFSAFHIQNLTDTVLLLPNIEGSVLIHDLTRCSIAVGCHQYRMHSSSNVDVYLAVTSDPVIEHCSEIHFGGYPSVLGSTITPSKHAHVLDFSHIRATPSPNWSVLTADRISCSWPLHTSEVTDVLEATRDNMLPKC